MNIEELYNHTILIVDDTPTNLGFLFKFLSGMGFKVWLTHDGESALEIIGEEKPDLILLDVLMPGKSGYEVCRLIKQNEATSEIPIIFISALNETIDKVKGFEAGAVDYITKPIQCEEVLARVVAHLTIRNQQKKLSELNASKDRFFSIVSHDLRNAFMNILGFSQLMRESVEELNKKEITLQEMQEIADKTYNSVKITYSLLENLLHWSSLQTGRAEFQPNNFALHKVCEKVSNLVSDIARNKEIKLNCNIDPAIQVYADENMVFTILRNLVSNAIKFTPRGGNVSIDAELKETFIAVSITDTGVGITEEEIANLFKIDEHQSKLGTENEKGTGLGLTLCKELVEKHGGRISVFGQPGKGSTFKFTIPSAR
ncbi:MAG: hybrid sensor histidine kinase/response regulator [bacterium]